MNEKLIDGLTLEERLEGLEFGFHNNRLEGLEQSEESKEQMRSWVRQGLTSEEMIDRIKAIYIPKTG